MLVSLMLGSYIVNFEMLAWICDTLQLLWIEINFFSNKTKYVIVSKHLFQFLVFCFMSNEQERWFKHWNTNHLEKTSNDNVRVPTIQRDQSGWIHQRSPQSKSIWTLYQLQIVYIYCYSWNWNELINSKSNPRLSIGV